MTITIEELRLVQSQGATDLISTLRSVEINAIDICNRSCSFCPRSLDAYVNKTEQISLGLISKLANDLEEIKFNGRVSFAGFGEPLLYKNLLPGIEIIKETVKNIKWIEIITNGDYLTSSKIKDLGLAGCTDIIVSMYDSDISDEILNLKEDSSIAFSFKKYFNGFNGVNRKDILEENSQLNISRPCFLPFYKMFIDVNGDAMLCSNDWTRKSILGNINHDSVIDIWLGETVNSYRSNLIKGHRKNCGPCKSCNVNGTTLGNESAAIWKLND